MSERTWRAFVGAGLLVAVGLVSIPMILDLTSKTNTHGCDQRVVDLALDKVVDKYKGAYGRVYIDSALPRMTAAELDSLETSLKCDRKWVDDLPKDKYDRCVKAAYYKWLETYFRLVAEGREELKKPVGSTKPEWQRIKEEYQRKQQELARFNASGKVPDMPAPKECEK